MAKKGRLKRTVTTKECPWLEKDLKKGKVVYEFNGCTYACIANGIAVSNRPDRSPFYEIPESTVEWNI